MLLAPPVPKMPETPLSELLDEVVTVETAGTTLLTTVAGLVTRLVVVWPEIVFWVGEEEIFK